MSSPSASTLLARLRDPAADAPPARLAALLVDEVLAQPIRALVSPAHTSKALQDGLLAWSASDAASARARAEVEGIRGLLGAHAAPVGDLLPTPLREGLRRFAQLPFTTRREAVLKLLDRPSFKAVVRAQLAQTLADFGRRAASPVADNAIARGLGGLGKLAGQIARPSPLGAIASAVSGEVERQVEKRAADFADSAVAGVLNGIADQASDPAKAQQQAALRVELLEGLLGLTGADLAELASGNVEKQVAIIREALGGWASTPGFTQDVETPLAWWLARNGNRPLGALLDDLAIRETVVSHARAIVHETMLLVTAGGAFARWLEELAS